jgi:hypothetical protein
MADQTPSGKDTVDPGTGSAVSALGGLNAAHASQTALEQWRRH